MDVPWLSGPEGTDAIATAARVLAEHRDPLAAGTELRRKLPDLDPARARAALAQAELRRLAHDRYQITEPLLLTREGLEQATRPAVAARRASTLVAGGVHRVIDLTAGLGFDTRAFLAAGLVVTAVERDATTAALLAANAPGAEVMVADALDVLPGLLATLSPTDVVFVDPARRQAGGSRDATGRAHPERDPERWAPPWSAVVAIPHPRVAAKVAPGLTPPDGWQAEWVSVHRTVVECSLASWPVRAADRVATVLRDGRCTTLAAVPAHEQPVPPGSWLHEPDPAIIRAGAVDALAEHGLHRIDDVGTWLTSDGPAEVAIADAVQSYRVLTDLSGSPTHQRRTLDTMNVTGLTVLSREAGAAPATVLRELRRREGAGHAIVIARCGGQLRRWLVTT